MSRRALVVDDEEAVRRTVMRALGLVDYEAEGAADGPEALARLEEHPVELLVVDLTLPGPDGLRLVRSLRARGDHTPVLLISGAGDLESRLPTAEAQRLGITVLAKPFDVAGLLDAVRGMGEP